MFSAYIERPIDCRFEGQDPDEKIILLLRAHPITNLSWIIPSVLLFLASFLIPEAFQFLNLEFSGFPRTFEIILLIINYLLVLVITFEGFLNWYFNVIFVTEKNIVDVDFYSLLFKNIDIAPLRNVEDTSSSMGGILKSIFHYGNVFVQTAGTTKNIDLHNVPRPHHVADLILDAAHKIYERGKNANQPPA